LVDFLKDYFYFFRQSHRAESRQRSQTSLVVPVYRSFRLS